MKTLIIILAVIAGAKVAIQFGLLMLKRQPKSNISAEDLIRKDLNHRSKEQIESIMNNYKREEVNLLAYNVSKKFGHMMQKGLLKRQEILIIRKYLESTTEPSKAKYTNDAHAIYSMLKNSSIEDDVLFNVISFIDNVATVETEKEAITQKYKSKIREVK